MRIILASQSPYRKKALDLLGLKYETIPGNIDEKAIRTENPYELPKVLSEAKAKFIGESEKDAIIISGDLIVIFEGKIYEKPETREEAFEMLRSFSGKEVDIVSSVAVYNTKTEEMLSASGKCTVKMRELTDYEINDYISRSNVLKFAGAFDTEGVVRFAESSNGEIPYITALPMNNLILFLRKNDVKV